MFIVTSICFNMTTRKFKIMYVPHICGSYYISFKQILSEEGKLWLMGQSNLPLIFINNILLGHSHAHLFGYRLWSLVAVTETVLSAKPKISTIQPFIEKKV